MISHINCTMFRLLKDNVNKEYYLHFGSYLYNSNHQDYNLIERVNVDRADYINVPEFEIENLHLLKDVNSFETPIFRMIGNHLSVDLDYAKNTNSKPTSNSSSNRTK